jgi:hypothetical protein
MEQGQPDPTPDLPDQGDSGQGSQSSSSNVTLEELANRFTKLESMLKGLQSGNDKEVARVKQQLNVLGDTVNKQLERYEAYREKFDPTEARRQMALDQLIDQNFGGEVGDLSPEGKTLASPPPPASVEVDDDLLNLLGVNPNDPRLAAGIAEGKDPLTIAKELARSARQQPDQSNASGVVPVSGGTSTNKTAGLQAEYNTRVAKIRRGDVSGLEELKREFRAKGLQVW